MGRLALALLLLIAVASGIVLLTRPSAEADPATFTVDSTGDGGDSNTADGVCDDGSGNCTLRAAIDQANADAGTDTIEFDIAGAGPHTISPGSALPTITDPVIIDGTSEPDFSGTPIIELDGSGAGADVDGLSITAGSSTVKGLVINRFDGHGIELSVNGGNTIEGNYIGMDVSGTADLGNSQDGVYISGAPSNTIGGTAEGARNVISGNNNYGVAIGGSGATGNQVQGNYIGTDVTGSADLGNSYYGVLINGTPTNTIGGTTEAARNVISGNDSYGVVITNTGATGNLVQGNLIGTDVTGTTALGNSYGGVYINGAPSNTIGGTTAAERNVISANGQRGIRIQGSSATGNQVQGNYIGTDVTGTADLGNTYEGVYIDTGASNNTIGGTAAGAGNVISGNTFYGVQILTGATGNLVQGNYIGTDKNGTADLGNSYSGVKVTDTPGNTIGGTAAGAGNVISGNDWPGVFISNSGATGNLVQGNYIGTDVTGTADLGNSGDGVRIASAPGNTIGGATAGARNVISGNGGDGVGLDNGATGNQVQGNFIGTDVNGTAALGNGSDGVHITNAPSNTIGGTAAGAGNVISGNGNQGVYIHGSDATLNQVQGNFIGTDVTGIADLGNALCGVVISQDASSNTIGGMAEEARNVISGHDLQGVFIGYGATGNQVVGNYIGTDVTGTADLGNTYDGVRIWEAPNNTIGGTASGESNTIAYNTGDGVRVSGAASTGNSVSGNSIHSNGGKGIENIDGGNNELPPSIVDSVGSVSGHTEPKCYPCTVEVFSDDDAEGRIYEGSVSTNDDGNGSWFFAGSVSGPHVTATVTDADGNTSEFWGDADGDGVHVDVDNCPDVSNPGQENNDGDGEGDVCDPDDDNDALPDTWEDSYACTDKWTADASDDDDTDGLTHTQEYAAGTDPCDDDTDNDTVLDGDDADPLDEYVCQDVDSDTCDDCSVLGQPDTSNDGPDNESDGLCDAGDPDDDNDTVLDGDDADPLDEYVCQDVDSDTCDDCSVLGQPDTSDDGTDTDTDGACDAGDVCTNDPDDDIDDDGICVGSGFLSPKIGDNDNCPADPNPSQANSDTDSHGDACDNCPSDTNEDQANADGDAWGDACDNCPTTATLWVVPVGDDDCDGFTTAEEGVIGTDPADACPDNPSHDAWPPDLNAGTGCEVGHDGSVDIMDVLCYKWKLSAGGWPYDARYDLNQNPVGAVNILDVLRYKWFINMSCTNP